MINQREVAPMNNEDLDLILSDVYWNLNNRGVWMVPG
jgi:hypothetical protein